MAGRGFGCNLGTYPVFSCSAGPCHQPVHSNILTTYSSCVCVCVRSCTPLWCCTENYHVASFFALMKQHNLQIFNTLPRDQYSTARKLIINMVRAYPLFAAIVSRIPARRPHVFEPEYDLFVTPSCTLSVLAVAIRFWPLT